MSAAKAGMPPEVSALWPAPAVARLARKGSAGCLEYFIAPALRRPRIVVPRAVTGAERMFVRHGGGLLDRVVWTAWRRGHDWDVAGRLPISRLVVEPDPAGIEAFLSDVVGQPVGIGVLLGPPRANRKPVIQVFDSAGVTIAFAKVGLSPLTRDLLAAEAEALARIAAVQPRTFRVASVLHHGEWKANPLLVQAALGSAQRRQAPVDPPLDVMVEIAGLAGIEPADPGNAGFLDSISPPPGDDWNGIEVTALHRLRARIADDRRALPFGSWHGDFGPWNMARDGSMIEVWDWERFRTGVPVGLDAAHYRTQVSLRDQVDPAVAWPLMVTDVEAVLAASGLAIDAAPKVAAYYVLAICARYRHDAGDVPNPALRRRMSWLAATAEIAAARVEVSAS